MPVISQAVNLPCTDPYLWYTVIPRHNNDLNKHKTKTQAYIDTKVCRMLVSLGTSDLCVVSGLYYRGIGQVMHVQVIIHVPLGPNELSTLCWLPYYHTKDYHQVNCNLIITKECLGNC